MDLIEHSYDAYVRELSRRDELRRALALPIGLSVVLAGAWYSLLGRFDWLAVPEPFSIAFAVLSAVGVLALIAGAHFLICSHVGYVYVYMPTAKEVIGYSDELVDYYQVGNRADLHVEADVVEFLTKEYAENAHENAMNNNTKSKHLHNASVRLVASLVFLAAAGVADLLARVGEIL